MYPVQEHYARSGPGSAIAERIPEALRDSAGAAADVTPQTLAPYDHIHGRGLLATRDLVALLEPSEGEAILDIGCGIGGPARWIASEAKCRVTGGRPHGGVLRRGGCHDSRLRAPLHAVRIHEGSVLALPLPDAFFDKAYSHNVVMNIGDQARVYREAYRRAEAGRQAGAVPPQRRRGARDGLPRALGIRPRDQLPRLGRRDSA